MTREEWRDIPGYEGAYQVSDQGRVRSVDRWSEVVDARGRQYTRRVQGRGLAPGRSSNGYLTVVVAGKSTPVQWLVAAAFIGPRPAGFYVLHGNGCRQDNRAVNLRYGTPAENSADKIAHGTATRGLSNGGRFSDEIVRSLRTEWRNRPLPELVELLGASAAAVSMARNGRTYRHVA